MISGRQIRAARALLDFDQSRLAELCGLTIPTIQHMEESEGVIPHLGQRGSSLASSARHVAQPSKQVYAVAQGGIQPCANSWKPASKPLPQCTKDETVAVRPAVL
jgi:hypothetical protein